MIEPRFCVLCGGKLVPVPHDGRVRHVCSRCGHVHYLNPIVAAGGLIEAEGRVLLIRRAVPPREGLWALPAGYAEIGEHPTQTAQREILEETGVDAEIERLLDIATFGDDDQPFGILLLYAGHAVGTQTHAGDDAIEARFFAPEEIPGDIAFAAHRRALDHWRSGAADERTHPGPEVMR